MIDHSSRGYQVRSVALAALLAATSSCASVAASAAQDSATRASDEAAADPLINRAWMQHNADRPGVIRAFLSNGTMLMDSCWETFRLETWRLNDDGLVWSEDASEIRADLVSVSETELVLDLRLSDAVERQRFVPAQVPYLCPDFPKDADASASSPTVTYGCDDPEGEPFTFGVRFGDEQAELDLPERFDTSGSIVVPQVRAASGAKYEGDGILFWIAGERVRFDVDDTTFGPCAEWPSEPQASDPWDQARADGIAFRALGQEPFWKLDIVPGRWMRFELVGADAVSTPVPEAQVDDGVTVYRAVTEAHDLRVAIESTVCHDTMSGQEFEARVSITLDGEAFQGCGREP